MSAAPPTRRALRPVRLRSVEVMRLGGSGLLARRLRAALSALGISIGVAALVAVLGISTSSRRDLVTRLGRYGNLLTAASGQSLTGNAAPLPATAPAMIRRIPPVRDVTTIGLVPGATVRRTSAIPSTSTGGIAVVTADADLVGALDATVAHGAFLNDATAQYPVVVLGFATARYLGVADVAPGRQVDIDGHLFAVVGILAPVEIAPEIDQTALIGYPIARSLLNFDGAATRLYVRTDPDQVAAVRRVLARTTNPSQPEAVLVSRASDLLAARSATRATFSALYLALGAVALLVGGIGIANVMVIAVLERRNEIGLRRALGATRGQVAMQFLVEAVLLATLGGVAGTLLGALAVAITTRVQSWPLSIPAVALWAAIGVSIVVGALAGVYPARRAASLSPSDALRSG